MSIIYIIGNGFDLYNRLNTGYCDFHRFVVQRYPDLGWDLEEHFRLDVDDQYLWRDFEQDLSTFDWESFFNWYNEVDISRENFRRNEVFGLEDELNQQGEAIVESKRSAFREWIEDLEYHESLQDDMILSIFQQGDRFISFNYTNTLERYYGISKSTILYIHNKLEEFGGELIFGHGTKHEVTPRSDELYEDGNTKRTIFTDAEDTSRSIFYKLRKDTDSVIENHHDFFEQLYGNEKIVVLGHSLGSVDWPYFKHLRGLLPDAWWQFSYNGEEDVRNIENLNLNVLGLSQKKIKLIRLDELGYL